MGTCAVARHSDGRGEHARQRNQRARDISRTSLPTNLHFWVHVNVIWIILADLMVYNSLMLTVPITRSMQNEEPVPRSGSGASLSPRISTNQSCKGLLFCAYCVIELLGRRNSSPPFFLSLPSRSLSIFLSSLYASEAIISFRDGRTARVSENAYPSSGYNVGPQFWPIQSLIKFELTSTFMNKDCKNKLRAK